MSETRFNTLTRQVEFYDPSRKTWSATPPASTSPTQQAYDYSNLTFNPGSPEDDSDRDPFKGYNRFLEFQLSSPESQANESDPFSTSTSSQQGVQGRIPTTTDELHAMIRSGEIKDKALIEKLEVELSNAELASSQESSPNNEYAMGPPEEGGGQPPKAPNFWTPALNFAGSDLSTEAYSLGMRLGQKQGAPGKTLGIIGSAGAFTLGAARDLLAGLSTQRANNWMTDWYEKNKNKKTYTADEQYTDNNYIGGLYKRDGGRVDDYMQDGGQITDKSQIGYRQPLDGSQAEKDQQAAFALFRNQYGDINYFADQYNKLRADMEQAYIENPNYADSEGNLIQRSYDPDRLQGPMVSMKESRRRARDLNRIIRKNNLPYQKIQHDAFYNPNGKTDMTARFQNGGYTSADNEEYVVGSYAEFEYGGEIVKGVIKKIENGKIYI